MPGTFAFQVPGAGFILCRQAADEAEVLTLAIAPEYRRQGLAGRLLDVAIAAAVKVGATAVFLEVAANNTPGLGLYAAAGFIQVGRRRRYYSTASGGIDALILRRGA